MWRKKKHLQKFKREICLTVSQESVGCSWRRNRTSAKAGYSSAADQLKLRLFFNQDIVIFCGMSCFTVEKMQIILCICFISTKLIQLSICAQLTCCSGRTVACFNLTCYWVKWEEHPVPMCWSSTDLLGDVQLEFPTWAATQISTGRFLIRVSPIIEHVVFLMPRCWTSLRMKTKSYERSKGSRNWDHLIMETAVPAPP